MPPNEFSDLVARLPHRGPMCLIDSLIQLDERSVEALTQFTEERLEFLGIESKVDSYWGIELIAQAGVLPLIAGALRGNTHTGVIIQVKSFHSFISEIIEPATLTTRCSSELLLNGSVASVRGSVSLGKTLICEAEITLSMQSD